MWPIDRLQCLFLLCMTKAALYSGVIIGRDVALFAIIVATGGLS